MFAKRFEVIADSFESMTAMMRLYGLSLSARRRSLAEAHFGTDWANDPAIIALGMTPIHAEMRFKLSRTIVDGTTFFSMHRVFRELWCEEGYLSEEEIDLARAGQLIGIKEIYPRAQALRTERPFNQRDTQLENAGWCGFDLGRTYSTGHRSEAFASERY